MSVAGSAAIEWHRARLIDFDLDKLLISGRPQLDVEFEPSIKPHEKFTVMYAPTREGENADNNYTSVDLYGVGIVRALISCGDFRVIYKLHPRIMGSRNLEVREAHERICALIEHSRRTGADNKYHSSGNVLSMFDQIDALVADVSSKGLDFLHLCPEKPLVIADRHQDLEQLPADAPIASACNVIDARKLSSLETLLPTRIQIDAFSEPRLAVRIFYFGDIRRGEPRNDSSPKSPTCCGKDKKSFHNIVVGIQPESKGTWPSGCRKIDSQPVQIPKKCTSVPPLIVDGLVSGFSFNADVSAYSSKMG